MMAAEYVNYGIMSRTTVLPQAVVLRYLLLSLLIERMREVLSPFLEHTNVCTYVGVAMISSQMSVERAGNCGELYVIA